MEMQRDRGTNRKADTGPKKRHIGRQKKQERKATRKIKSI